MKNFITTLSLVLTLILAVLSLPACAAQQDKVLAPQRVKTRVQEWTPPGASKTFGKKTWQKINGVWMSLQSSPESHHNGYTCSAAWRVHDERARGETAVHIHYGLRFYGRNTIPADPAGEYPACWSKMLRDTAGPRPVPPANPEKYWTYGWEGFK